MQAGMQKNVRLSEHGADLLRALKYDLDASDGEVIALALEQTALERLRYHAALLKRGRLGLLGEGEIKQSRAAVVPLIAALNSEKERFRIVEDGTIQTLLLDGTWTQGAVVRFSQKARAVVERTIELVKELMLPRATVSVLLLASCESPQGQACTGLGIPVTALATRLRQSLQEHQTAKSVDEVEFAPAAESVLFAGCPGVAARDGIQSVEVEHILIAALQSNDPDVAEAVAALHIDPDDARGRLWG